MNEIIDPHFATQLKIEMTEEEVKEKLLTIESDENPFNGMDELSELACNLAKAVCKISNYKISHEGNAIERHKSLHGHSYYTALVHFSIEGFNYRYALDINHSLSSFDWINWAANKIIIFMLSQRERLKGLRKCQ